MNSKLKPSVAPRSDKLEESCPYLELSESWQSLGLSLGRTRAELESSSGPWTDLALGMESDREQIGASGASVD
jgi:hypothetical protein